MYKVIYQDSSVFTGGDLKNSLWTNINNKIAQLIYYYPKLIKLENYESYNHIIEKAWINGKIYPLKILLMGQKNNVVDITCIDLKTNQITEYTKEFGKEYNNSSTSGWKEGIKYATK